MNITLPPRHDGHREVVESDLRSLIVIGANGSGKSRFTGVMIGDMKGSAIRISAVKALYVTARRYDGLPGSIDTTYARGMESKIFAQTDTTEFERLMALLMHEEMVNLIAYKVAMSGRRDGDDRPELPHTVLDGVIDLWQDLFPGNKVLLEGGKMLFTRDSEGDAYSPVRLSDGEQAVLFYTGATLRAMPGATIFVDSPTALLHPSLSGRLWDRLESLRPDCTFVYTTHDLDFASSRGNAEIVWVRDYDAQASTWNYSLLSSDNGLPDEVYLDIIGSRRPVLFIEGDDNHSIDSKLYPLIFPNYTVKALGSCNKVIESVRSFNGLESFHHLDSYGIVDRDRRDESEVAYLRRKRILVPAVAEVENILMLEDVVRTVAHHKGRDERKVFEKVKRSVIAAFESELRAQAMLHTRHRVKRTVEYRVDGRFNNINSLEEHMHELVDKINPRGLYESFCREFRRYVADDDYASVLKVYNRKTMIASSNVASLCGVQGNRNGYLGAILDILRAGGAEAERIRMAVRRAFDLADDEMKGLLSSEDTQSEIQILDDN